MATPSPPSGFRGAFDVDPGDLDEVSRSTGPVVLRPLARAAPADLEDLELLMGTARAEGWTLTPRGGGTGMPGGNVGAGLILDMCSGFTDLELMDLGADAAVVRAGVGARMSQIVDLARGSGFDIPPVPSSADRCTVGGVVANNAAGARTFLHGSIRPWVRGVEAVLPQGGRVGLDQSVDPPVFGSVLGRLQGDPAWAQGWPEVRKNSSGYALKEFSGTGRASDLLVGSEGTLAVISRVDIRLRRAPGSRSVHLVQIPTLSALTAIVGVANEIGAVACEFLGDRFLQMGELAADPIIGDVARHNWGVALIEVEGDVEEVQQSHSRMTGHWNAMGLNFQSEGTDDGMRALWGVRHRASPTIAKNAGPRRRSVQFIEDVVVPQHQLTAYLEGLDQILDRALMEAVIFGHAGDANVHVNPLVDFSDPGWRESVQEVLDGVTELTRHLGGTLSGEHGDGRIRAPHLQRVWSPAAFRAFEMVKDSVDPDRILNPGVILPLPGQDPLDGIGTAAGGRGGS